MRVFSKIQNILRGAKENGHAVANQKNKVSLQRAKKEIESLLIFQRKALRS